MHSSLVTRHSSLPCGALRRKAGMALVIVLGLISLLLISSVTFAIMMRIERASSANARNTTVARQSARSALAYALAAIDHNIGTNKWPAWQSSNDRRKPVWEYKSVPTLPLNQSGLASNARTLTFWKDTFGSVDHNIVKSKENSRASARILSAQMQEYLPHGISHRAYAQRYKSSTETGGKIEPKEDKYVIAPEWVPVTAGTNAVNLVNVVGRNAFLALNTSGYLDIPAICASGRVDRAYGRLPTEILPVSKFFRSGTNADKFKENNQGLCFENVADIRKAKKNIDKTNIEDGTVFAEGAAYSAFNYSPPERMPISDDNLIDNKRPIDVFPWLQKYPFKNAICIAGDGDDNHLKSLKRHKAAIVAAFMMSGLTASSGSFSHSAIKDNACSDKDCTVCGGNADAFTLPQYDYRNPGNGVAEQALWAYLGLIDYIDDDDVPEGSDDFEQFARPATENTPLFNGFMATVKVTREELAEEVPVEYQTDENGNKVIGPDGNPVVKRSEWVFDGKTANFKVEFNGKVVFANRCSADGGGAIAAYNDVLSGKQEAKLGFLFGGDSGGGDGSRDGDFLWQEFGNKIDSINIENANKHMNGALYMKNTDDHYQDNGPVCFLDVSAKEIHVQYSDVIDDPTALSDEEKDQRLPSFPAYVIVGAVGQVENSGGDIIHRFPADGSSYDTEDLGGGNGEWLESFFDCNKEFDGKYGWNTNSGYCTRYNLSSEHHVYPTVEIARDHPDAAHEYTLQAKTVKLILWGEPLDPLFASAATASYPGNFDQMQPRTVFASHNDSSVSGLYDDENNPGWRDCSLSRIDKLEIDGEKPFSGFGGAKNLVNLMKGKVDDFDDFVSDFHNPDYFDGYFEAAGYEHNDRYPCYSAFQKYFLTHKKPLDAFKGVTDGSRRTQYDNVESNDGLGIDDFEFQFQTAHVRNGGLDSAGELGFLPIGPYATIRLFGFHGERQFHKNEIDASCDSDDISWFNQVSRNRPYHRVLDFFGNRFKPTRGLINLNGCDKLAMASAFNGAALNDYLRDYIEDADAVIEESPALDIVVPALAKALDIRCDGIAGHVSDIGWLFDMGDEDLYRDGNDQIFTAELDNNMAREAMIRNTCGLFTTRGVNMTILLRGEAFTPFFGRSDVRNDLGTTLASRSAIAQVWRDTEPEPGDENKDPKDRHYPFFIQYFKIFDD